VSITLAGADVSGSLLTYTIHQAPLYGGLSGVSPDLTYTPMDNFAGLDSFLFTASNGVTESRPANVRIMVHPSSADTTPPEVQWTWPVAGATIEGLTSEIVMTDTAGALFGPSLLTKFSEALEASTVTTATVRVERAGGGLVEITPGYTEWSRWLTLVPREPWVTGQYTATLTTGLKDASGNSMEQDYAWSFGMAGAASDIYLPLVVKQTN
jgi:hypothetical protein